MATHIKNILENFFSQSKEKLSVYQRLDVVLDKGLDVSTGQHIHLKEVRERKLVLQADSSSALYNFSLEKLKVLALIQQEIASISDIEIKVTR